MMSWDIIPIYKSMLDSILDMDIFVLKPLNIGNCIDQKVL